MFKKRKIDRYWENDAYMRIRTLDQMNELNESQRRLKLVDGGEYQHQLSDIARMVEQMEANYSIFDAQMGHPLDALEGMFND